MGTYFRIVGNCGYSVTKNSLQRELRQVSSVLSNYDSNSEISRFNRLNKIGDWVPVNEMLAEVIAIAQRVSYRTDGALDVTVAPLVELWGFGKTQASEVPGALQIASALALVNYEYLEIDAHNRLLKKHRAVQLDVSAVGKGYGVDYIANFLEHLDCSDYLVDIGGEVRVLGRNASNRPWRIGIERPDSGRGVQKIIRLSSGAVATSGSYRNYRLYEQTTLPHLIDPRTGYPTSHNTLSVTVYHSNATEADALATALFVMGVDDALQFAESEDLAVAITTRDADQGKVVTTLSSAMDALLERGD